MSKLTQVEAARLMYAARRWAKAIEDTDKSPKSSRQKFAAREKAAEAAFADLVSAITLKEGE